MGSRDKCHSPSSWEVTARFTRECQESLAGMWVLYVDTPGQVFPDELGDCQAVASSCGTYHCYDHNG